MSRTLAAVAALLALLLTGCSSDDSGDAADPSSDAGSSSSDGGSAESGLHSVSGAGVTFLVPDTLEEVDPDQVAGNAEGDDTVAEVAQQMGMTTDQFDQYMQQVDLFLFDSESSGGFSTNVNVIPFAVSLPKTAALQQQLEQVGATVDDTQEVDTDAGPVTTIGYSIDMAGQSIVGTGIYVDLGDSSASITVSASDRDTADEIADAIVGSLEKS